MRWPLRKMARDSRYGERIVWSGRPKDLTAPPILRAAAYVAFATAAVSLCFAIVLAQALGSSPMSSLLFALWAATLGLLFLQGPKIWLARVEYVVTDTRVIWKRGPFRRSIGRKSISFARIFWSRSMPGVGDVELVRAVPTGALRRRLRLRLTGVTAPARVAAIIDGTEDVTPAAGDDRPLTQRLESGERVVWSARPRSTWRAYLPYGQRRLVQLVIGLGLLAVLGRLVMRGVPIVLALEDAGLRPSSLSFVALVMALGLTGIVMAAIGGYLSWDSTIGPGRRVRDTRYLVTDRRVLIQRGREELHLDRSKIVDVIDAPAGEGLRDVFLVLDGPQARALAASGAFGEREAGPSLRPVLERVEDAEGVQRILREQTPTLPRAA